ncbi:putative fatty acyl-CoA reductase CG5065 isoform X1 [Pieris napi]|uniref:putative fatty acyl-CoA reductase CG5065 isoform X1 n=2 Tax=Pieris napi TaxID=78633 RepID=UPI001FB973B0|nr:putative fatty acyl-CoA reductase CG5065 isoform X1 [Pieris napi]
MLQMATVTDFYCDKSIFITGGTGFIGKVLVEKLLRCCDVRRIYLLMRPRGGQGMKLRMRQYISSRAFDNIRADPHLFSKLQMMRGDLLSENLGLSAQDKQILLDDCQIIFHCAAQVKFDANIRDAVNMNVTGVQRMLELAATLHRLEVFVHMSTTFCRADLPVLEEVLYPVKHQPCDVIRATQWMDLDTLTLMEKKLIAPQPNTYSYTKSLAEELVSQYAGKFPIAIARPSIVTASLKEPHPGWVDNMNGPTGIIVGAGKGVIRSMLCDHKQQVDALPVDLVVNGCILLAYKTALQRPKEIVVFNLARSDKNPITWGEAIDLARSNVAEYPFTMPLWYPGGSPKTNKFHHYIAVLFTHLLPAYLVDFYLILAGHKPFLVTIHKRVNYGLRVLQYYTVQSWRFTNERYLSLSNTISKEEDEVFYTNPEAIEWNSYVRNYIKGAREFCCGEDPATLPQARQLHQRLFYMDLLLKIFLTCSLLYFVSYVSLKVSSIF